MHSNEHRRTEIMMLALVIPIAELGGGRPDNSLPGVPPGIWPSPGHPAHPIAPGGSPPGIWPQPPVGIWPNPPGGGGIPMPPIYYPPGVNVPVFPTHPIAPGGGGGGSPPIAGWTPPGFHPSHPIAPGGGGGGGGGSEQGGWAYSPIYGWVWVPEGSGGKPKPPSGGGGGSPDQGLPEGQPTPTAQLGG